MAKDKIWQVIEYSGDLRDFDATLLDRGLEFSRTKEEGVRSILEDVRQQGDQALIEYTARFDRVALQPENLSVTSEELRDAASRVSKEFIQALEEAIERIRRYHQRQLPQNWSYEDQGAVLGRRYVPMQRVGVYVPGGRAPYPSSVLMNVIPPQVAGVKEIVLVTPPGPRGKLNPHVLTAAYLLGITEIYRVGGAQAIGALAYGTESINKVDKICGPGNIYVTIAKKLVYGSVGIDMLAGPSEIAVVADETADPRFVAADLLSQAEHDPEAGAFLFTTSPRLAGAVEQELERQLTNLTRAETAKESLKSWGRCFIVESVDYAIQLVNLLAPEHLELYVENPQDHLAKVSAAGTVFLGGYTPEPLGDYASGTNHILPTHGTARFSSGLSVDDFLKPMSFSQYNSKALKKLADTVLILAETEGFSAHANAIRVRLEEEKNE